MYKNDYWISKSLNLIIQKLIAELKEIKSRKITFQSKTLQSLKYNVLKCFKCNLYKTRNNIVFGCGNQQANLVFVGEAPGIEEDFQAKPFVGAAGQLLTKMIEAMRLKRSDVYICNIIKCKPPNNRNPNQNEIDNCIIYLKEQLHIIQPKVIITLGRYAYQALLNTTMSISKARGIFTNYENIPLMPTFHPAYLLRNNSKKKCVWSDLKQVIKLLN